MWRYCYCQVTRDWFLFKAWKSIKSKGRTECFSLKSSSFFCHAWNPIIVNLSVYLWKKHCALLHRYNFEKQECIPVGCVPSAAVVTSGVGVPSKGEVSGWGVVSGQGGVCHTPCEQNHRCLWKHYLAATTLQTVESLQCPLPPPIKYSGLVGEMWVTHLVLVSWINKQPSSFESDFSSPLGFSSNADSRII